MELDGILPIQPYIKVLQVESSPTVFLMDQIIMYMVVGRNFVGQELMMNYLNTIPKFLFFTGKGGVGKTSLSCATAIRLADEGKRILLVSTDPASNVGQVFGQQIGNTLTVISDVPGLTALEIDPQAAAQQYRARIVDPVKGILPEDVVRSIEEQLSGACKIGRAHV